MSADRPADGLADVLARVDHLLAHAVQVMTLAPGGAGAGSAGGGPAGSVGDPFRGLYVSEADAARLATRGSAPVGAALAMARPLVDLTRAGPRWRRLADALSLGSAEVDLLALALAPEVDLRYERIYGFLHDDVTKRRLTPDLALQLLCGTFEERLAGRRLFADDGALARFGLARLVADPSQPHSPQIGHAVKLDDEIVSFLLGEGAGATGLGGAVQEDDASPEHLPPEAAALVERLAAALQVESPAHFLLLGPDEGLKLDVARGVARALDRALLVIDLDHLARLDQPFDEAVLGAARAARLQDALPFWTHGDALRVIKEGDEGPARVEIWLAALAAMGDEAALLAAQDYEPAGPGSLADRFVRIEFALPDSVARREVWERRLEGRDAELATDDAALLAEAFQLDGSGIDRAVQRAARHARWRRPEAPAVTGAELFAAARAQVARALPRYATRLDAARRWDDLVLPAEPLAQLRELCHRVRYRHTVLEQWGFARRLTLGRGVAALFAGPSGTGKTLAAQIIAATLGLDLYRVEIPAVVSKYIGDTEKALDQLFREAQRTSVVLFFDEADALFGKRSEVRDAHDRYANIEISYLLQALEQYDGLTILATNLRHNVDDAFVRRLAFVVTFPFPEEGERRRIWAQCWPEQVPIAEDVAPDFLARHFKLTGGNIRNVALAAAFTAAADGGRVTMAHVIRGVRREYQKMGKVCTAAEFGPYFELFAS